MSKKSVEIRPAKGRPMLTWVGKRPLQQVTAFPAQHIETFDPSRDAAKRQGPVWQNWSQGFPKGGLLFHGDNKEVLASLLANGFRGKVRLIYIDPPFDSGADYLRRVKLRGPKGSAKIEGEAYTLGEQIQYTDIWSNDNYLQFMFERLLILKELLSEDGSILVHADCRKGYHIRCLLDEVFGPSNFRNEIIVRRGVKSLQAQFDSIDALSSGNDMVYLYSKGPDTRYPKLQTVLKETRPGTWNNHWRGTDRPTMRYELLGVTPADGQWRWSRERSLKAVSNHRGFLEVADNYGGIDDYYAAMKSRGTELDFIRLNGAGKPEHYVPPATSRLCSAVWTDIRAYDSGAPFPTQKSEQLIERILRWLTAPGDMVLDCFVGSGTTAAVAQKLGRRWIACDINRGAIQTTSKRLQSAIQGQIEAGNKRNRAQNDIILNDEKDTEPRPAQLSFAVYKVNDYDLQIQHNEAVNLACEHIGVSRTRVDPFFDGTLGRRLVKIVPFNHPLTPLDLEELREELEARPDEGRDVVIVCLGKQVAADAWLEDWNRLRKSEGFPNKIQVIELRTDPKYGKFFVHRPAEAKVSIRRSNHKIEVDIEDFISPTVIERLSQQSDLLAPEIDDWRWMVDSVMIDPAYDGEVLNVVLCDVPERKKDLVLGSYELPAPADKTTVAVKITDVLGEEILVLRERV